ILQEGGNAFDAALGALACACVSEPVLASLGAGGYLLATSPSNDPILFDFFAQTPREKRPEDELDFESVYVDFGADTQEFHIGHGSCAVPGVVKALHEVSESHGRLPFTEIVKPAIQRAKEGIALSPMQASVFRVVEPILRADPAFESLITKAEDNALIEAGDHFCWPNVADMLDALGNEGARLFYEGEIAAEIVDQSQSNGGHLSMADFAKYELAIRRPLILGHRDWTIALNPPPSAGGALVALMLKALAADEPLPMERSATRYNRLVQAMEAVNSIRKDMEGSMDVHSESLLDPTLLAKYLEDVETAPQVRRGTTHISVSDTIGNAVALSVSNGEGCGRMAPFGAFMLNNMLGEEDLNPAGFHQWPTDTRLASMMSPGIAQDRTGRRIAFGSGGSNRIRTAIAQVLLNLIDGGLPLAEAIEEPRLHLEPDMLHIEGGIEPDMIQIGDLYEENHRFWPEQSLFFGGVHLAGAQPDGSGEAAADSRRGGAPWVG
ncbi:MAG: gamma-glutamyltransferase, partial [Pseudomonadota bacterium]